MDIKLQKINNIEVRPIPLKSKKQQPIKGFELFPELYANIFICSKKKTGKTTIINTILNRCMGKDTKLIVFSTTYQKDKNMKNIIKKWKKKNTVLTYHNIKSADGVDELDQIINTLGDTKDESDSDESDDSDDDKRELSFCCFDTGGEPETIPRKRKSKYIAPEYIFVLDDLADELRLKSVYKLLSTNRHYKCKVILSNQWLRSIQPNSRRQLDYLLLLQGHSDEKLIEIYNELDLTIDLQCFIKMYKQITYNKRYSFLYVDILDGNYRQNFNTKLNINQVCN